MLSSRLLWGHDPVSLLEATAGAKKRLVSNTIRHTTNSQQNHPRTSCLQQRGACARHVPKLGRRLSSNVNSQVTNEDIASAATSSSTAPYPYIDQSMCIATAEWQSTFTTNCNVFHEVSMSNSLNNGRWRTDGEALYELGSGKWRSAWKLQRNGIILNNDNTRSNGATRRTTAESVVLKTLNYIDRVHFDRLTYQRNQMDAKISERVSSRYSVEIYGFCGQSALNEVADRTLSEDMKEMWDAAVAKGKMNGVDAARDEWSKSLLKRLRYARDTARALAYIQSIDAPKRWDRLKRTDLWNVTIAHNDFRVSASYFCLDISITSKYGIY